MKKVMNYFLTVGLFFLTLAAFAQTQSVSGTVTDSNGDPVIAATVRATGTNIGTVTDLEGNFTLQVPSDAQTLTISYVGMTSKTIPIDGGFVTVTLDSDDNLLEGVVVTALNIARDKKSLGYATQTVTAEDVNDVQSSNFADALSGEVAGLDIQSYNTMGGSANIVVRGYSSLTGNNQALIVIDGTPVLNDTGNSSNQQSGRGGFDYGNAAMDINPNDIESVTTLKGAAATALYGSRASNGAIIITTKKGKTKKGLGVSFTSNATIGKADSSTLPKYQNKYGAGYGPFYGGPGGLWDVADVDGDGIDDLIPTTGEDASYGPAFDDNLLVYNWYNLIPGYGDYLEKQPFSAPKNTALDFLETTSTFTNTISLEGGTDQSNFRLGFTNLNEDGLLPNSSLDRNSISLSAGNNFSEQLHANFNLSYTKTDGKGRYGTGYDGRNVFQSFRQWWQVNADVDKLRDVFNQTGQNYSWNMNGYNGGDFFAPHYFDNPYWMRYNTFNTDSRNRYLGNVALDYDITKGINILGRVAFDSYNEIREERINVGSVDVSEYYLYTHTNTERNYDIIATFDRQVNSSLDLNGNLGWNLRVNNRDFLSQSTNGGLITPGLYNFDNSANPLTPANSTLYDATKKVDGFYGRISAGINDTYFIEATGRTDRSSALPKSHNRYFYPSISSSFIFSRVLDPSWLTFGKLRANYAEVGSDTDPYRVFSTYGIVPSFQGQASSSNPSTFNNPDLRSESTAEFELGLEMSIIENRASFDFSYYNRKTEDLITPVDVSSSSGASALWLNGGSIKNSGFEFFTTLTPVKTDDFSWDMKFNFAKNESKVLELAEGIDFLQLASVQGGVSIGAKVGDPYGVIRGRDFVYHENGRPIVYTAEDAPSSSWVGMYQRTASSNEVLGDINPDWTGGLKNQFNYKNFDFSFLIDMQRGGNVFSLDTWYGYATGLYDFTGGTNDLGNPVRNSIAEGGGVILDGVNADGTPNETRGYAGWYANPWGYARTPNAAHVYDASFVKLRELKFGYSLPTSLVSRWKVQDVNFAIQSRNPWIISKKVPYSDPEAGLSAGNVQGNQSGAYPSIKQTGLSLNIKF